MSAVMHNDPFRWPAVVCYAVEYALNLAAARYWLGLAAVIALKVWLA